MCVCVVVVFLGGALGGGAREGGGAGAKITVTVFINHGFGGERRAEAESNRGGEAKLHVLGCWLTF